MNYRRVKIITTPTSPARQTAAALEYTPGEDQAPRVIASGQGNVAEKIIALAKEHKIPIYEDSVLANALASVDLGGEIPPQMYLVVAEVLAYIYRIKNKAGHATNQPPEPGVPNTRE